MIILEIIALVLSLFVLISTKQIPFQTIALAISVSAIAVLMTSVAPDGAPAKERLLAFLVLVIGYSIVFVHLVSQSRKKQSEVDE